VSDEASTPLETAQVCQSALAMAGRDGIFTSRFASVVQGGLCATTRGSSGIVGHARDGTAAEDEIDEDGGGDVRVGRGAAGRLLRAESNRSLP
jgi:hypothetical protein